MPKSVDNLEDKYRKRLAELEKTRALRDLIEACEICSIMEWVVPQWCAGGLNFLGMLFDKDRIYIQPIIAKRWSTFLRDYEIYMSFRKNELNYFSLEKKMGTNRPLKKCLVYEEVAHQFDLHKN